MAEPLNQRNTSRNNQKAEWASNKIENVLKLEGPINGEISDNNMLNISSAKFPIVEYIIDVKVESPVDPTSHVTHHRIEPNLQNTKDSFYTASKVTVSVYVMITAVSKNNVRAQFTGKSPITRSFTNTATLIPPDSVTLAVDSGRALAGTVKGISQDSKAVVIELVGIALDRNISPKQTKPGSERDTPYSFAPKDYMQFSGKEFIVQSQSSRDGLQSSSFTKSPAVHQAPLLGTLTHSLPVFSAKKTGAVDITWNPPSGGLSEIQTLLCEVIDSSKNPLLTQSIGKPIPGTVPIDVKELAAKAVPNSKLQFWAAYTPSNNNIANSGYSVDSTSFEILSAPTEFSVTYVESKLSGVLSISWLPQSDTDKYQVQFVDTASKDVVVSREFNNTHHAHKTTGKHLSSYKLLPSDMNKLQPGHNYSVEMYSLGNDTSFLFSVTPTVLPSVVHYPSEVKKLSAVYNEEMDKITITFSQVPNAKKYKFYVLTQPKTDPPTKAVVVATFSFPAPKKAASDKDKKNTSSRIEVF